MPAMTEEQICKEYTIIDNDLPIHDAEVDLYANDEIDIPQYRNAGDTMTEERAFANREREVEILIDRLIILQQEKSVPNRVINYYGVPGIGKSRLLREMQKLPAVRELSTTLFIDLETYAQPSELLPMKVQFLQALFTSNNRYAFPEDQRDMIEEKLGRLSDQPDEDHLNAALVAVTSGIIARAHQTPVVVYLDSCEHARDAIFAWIERMVLLPLIQSERVLCVVASQMEMRWRHHHVRRHVESFAMSALDQYATRIHAGQNTTIGDEIYRFTFGHPLSNEVVLDMLPEQSDEIDWLMHHRREVATRVVDRLLKRSIANINEDLKQILLVLSLFREFDVHTLRSILPDFLTGFSYRSQSALHGVIKQLIETRLVSWSNLSHAYQIDGTVRNILAQLLRINDPERYANIVNRAQAYYRQLVAKTDTPESRDAYVAEYIFQLLQGQTGGMLDTEQFANLLRPDLEHWYLQHEKSAATTKLHALQGQLERDTDMREFLVYHGWSATLPIDAVNVLLSP